jgi:sugar phosphate isomerase/epimerase
MTAGPPGRLDADEACDAFAAALDPVRAEAAAAGVPLALEHNHALRRDIGFLHTLRDMVEYAEQVDLGIVVELNNCWIERRLPQTFRRGAPRFSVVQVSDYAIGTSDTPNRLVPGDGDIPLERLLGLLLEAGYAGPFDLEFLGPKIEAEGYAPAIRRGVAWLSDTLERLGA